MSSVVECLLALRDNVAIGLGENLSNYAAKTPTRPVVPFSTPGKRSPGEDRRRGLWDPKSPQRSPLLSGMCFLCFSWMTCYGSFGPLNIVMICYLEVQTNYTWYLAVTTDDCSTAH